MKKMLVTAAAMVALTAIGSAYAAGNPVAGEKKSSTCAACHGPDGNSATGNFPKLAGQHESYIIKQLQDFKSGARKDPVMSPQAANLSEEDMADLAAYFSSQKIKPGKTDKDLATVGERVWRGGNPEANVPACTGCHGPAGSGNPAAKFPMLHGQQAEYVTKQLTNFRAAGRVDPDAVKEGEDMPGRHNDAGRMMQNTAKGLDDYEIKAVASYIQGLRP